MSEFRSDIRIHGASPREVLTFLVEQLERADDVELNRGYLNARLEGKWMGVACVTGGPDLPGVTHVFIEEPMLGLIDWGQPDWTVWAHTWFSRGIDWTSRDLLQSGRVRFSESRSPGDSWEVRVDDVVRNAPEATRAIHQYIEASLAALRVELGEAGRVLDEVQGPLAPPPDWAWIQRGDGRWATDRCGFWREGWAPVRRYWDGDHDLAPAFAGIGADAATPGRSLFNAGTECIVFCGPDYEVVCAADLLPEPEIETWCTAGPDRPVAGYAGSEIVCVLMPTRPASGTPPLDLSDSDEIPF